MVLHLVQGFTLGPRSYAWSSVLRVVHGLTLGPRSYAWSTVLRLRRFQLRVTTMLLHTYQFSFLIFLGCFSATIPWDFSQEIGGRLGIWGFCIAILGIFSKFYRLVFTVLSNSGSKSD